MAHSHSASFLTRLLKKPSGDFHKHKRRPSTPGAHERFLENEGLLQPAGTESVGRLEPKPAKLVPREDSYIPRSSPANPSPSRRMRPHRTQRSAASSAGYDLAKQSAFQPTADKYIGYSDNHPSVRSSLSGHTRSDSDEPTQPPARVSLMRRLRSKTLKHQQTYNDPSPALQIPYKAVALARDDWPYPEDYVPAPVPTFGEIPGFGAEQVRPSVDLSSGAAARAAASAQNKLLEKMRKMEVSEDTFSPYYISPSEESSDNNHTYFTTSLRRENPVQYLPREIMSEVFTYLDPNSLLNAELVSHDWNTVASSQYVWKQMFLAEFTPCYNQTGMDQGTKSIIPQGDWKTRWRVQRALSKRWLEGKAAAIYLEGHTDSVYCVQFDQEKIITGSRDRTIRVWSMQTLKCVKVLGWPSRLNHEMDPLPDDSEAPDDGIRPFARIHPPRGASPNLAESLSLYHTGSILCLHFDDQIMVTGSSDKSLIVWEVKPDYHFIPTKRLTEHTHNVLDVSFDQSHIVSCSKDRSICVWSRDTGDCLRKLIGHNGPVNAAKLRGDFLVSVGGDSVAKMWNARTGEFMREFASHKRGLACVEFSQDSNTIFAGGNNKVVYEFDRDGNLIKELKGHGNLVRSVDTNSGRVVTGSYDYSVKTWNQTTGDLINSFPKWTSSWILSTKADYRRIIATSQDSRVFVMDFGYDLRGIELLES